MIRELERLLAGKRFVQQKTKTQTKTKTMSNLAQTFNCGSGCVSDADSIYKDMIDKPGDFNRAFSKGILDSGKDKFLDIFQRKRRAMNVNGSSVERQMVYRYTQPNETEVGDWKRMGTLVEGGTPCCNPPREIELGGSEEVSGCLYQESIQSQPFCKEELMYKWNPGEQMQQIETNLTVYSRKLWELWAWDAYVQSVNCTILSGKYSHPTQKGDYPAIAGVVPTTKLLMGHVENITDQNEDEPGIMQGDVVSGYKHIWFVSRETLSHLRKDYYADIASHSPQYRTNSKPMDVYITGIGSMTQIGPYMFCPVRRPRRYRSRANGELWRDAVVASVINVPTTRGATEKVNPEYKSTKTAPYEESICYSDSAVDWIIPPDELREGQGFFRPTDYMGRFYPVSPIPFTECRDPQSKIVRFVAEFASGTMPMAPETGRAVLHVRAKRCVADVEDDCEFCSDEDVCTPVQVKCSTIDGSLILISPEPLPMTAPDGTGIFLETQQGKFQLLESITGPGIQDAVGKYHTTVQLPSEFAGNATERLCDPWDKLCIKDLETPTTVTENDCSQCNGTTPITDTDTDGDGVVDTAQCTSKFATLRVEGFALTAGGSNELAANAPYTSADSATLLTDIQAIVDANGGGTTEATWDANGIVCVTITGHNPAGLDLTVAEFTIQSPDGTDTVGFECVLP